VRDIVGLYLNPPDKALVLCVDEKSQIQALERTQPVLPLGLGYLEGVTHDYYRHGTTTLFAALDVQSGQVITQCKPHHGHQEFLSFLRHLDESVPAALDLHLIIDNYATHKHPRVRAWLAAHSRYHVHYTPTYSSWLNQVERWFGRITPQSIRRGSFRNVKELVQRIAAYVAHYNRHAGPFLWTATADSILAKLERLSTVICGTPHEPIQLVRNYDPLSLSCALTELLLKCCGIWASIRKWTSSTGSVDFFCRPMAGRAALAGRTRRP
jgi:transposase